MIEKHFPCIIFINSRKKPTIEDIKNQLMNEEHLISDEEAFLRHLIRKWAK